MPKQSNQSIKAFRPYNNIEELGSWANDSEASIEEIEWKLRKFGLDAHEVELIMLRFMDGKSMIQIVKQQGWTNIDSANYYLKKTLKKLRDGGFKLR
jgi:hypothetical protein